MAGGSTRLDVRCLAEGRDVGHNLGILLMCWPIKDLHSARLAFVSPSGLACSETVDEMEG